MDFEEAKREAVAQVYEEAWVKTLSPMSAGNPRKHAELLAFMESKAGRPLEVF